MQRKVESFSLTCLGSSRPGRCPFHSLCRKHTHLRAHLSFSHPPITYRSTTSSQPLSPPIQTLLFLHTSTTITPSTFTHHTTRHTLTSTVQVLVLVPPQLLYSHPNFDSNFLYTNTHFTYSPSPPRYTFIATRRCKPFLLHTESALCSDTITPFSSNLGIALRVES